MLEKAATQLAKAVYGKDYVDENDRLKIAILALMMVVLPLIFVIVIMAFGYFRMADALEIKMRFPGVEWANEREAVIGYSQSNEFAYELYGRLVVQEIGWFNQADVDKRIHKIVMHMWPHDYDKYKDIISQFEQTVKSEHISLDFKPDKHEVVLSESGHKAVYTAKGVAHVKIGAEEQKPKNCNITVNLMTAGEIYVRSFSTDCL